MPKSTPPTDRFTPALDRLVDRIQEAFGSSPEDLTLLGDQDPMAKLISRKHADLLDSVAEVQASTAQLRSLVTKFTGDDPKEAQHIAGVADRLAGEVSRRNYHLNFLGIYLDHHPRSGCAPSPEPAVAARRPEQTTSTAARPSPSPSPATATAKATATATRSTSLRGPDARI